MKKYYIHNGQLQAGPFTKEELKANNIQSNSYVWCEGQTNWKLANEIEELKDLFSQSTPPPFLLQQQKPTTLPTVTPQARKQTKNKSAREVLIAVILVVIIVAGIFVYRNYRQSHGGDGSDNNFSNAKTDLRVTGTYSIGLFGMKTTINANLRNTSANKTYSNETVEINFLNDKEAVIGSTYKTFSLFLSPGTAQDVTFKIDNISGTKKVALGISSGN